MVKCEKEPSRKSNENFAIQLNYVCLQCTVHCVCQIYDETTQKNWWEKKQLWAKKLQIATKIQYYSQINLDVVRYILLVILILVSLINTRLFFFYTHCLIQRALNIVVNT